MWTRAADCALMMDSSIYAGGPTAFPWNIALCASAEDQPRPEVQPNSKLVNGSEPWAFVTAQELCLCYTASRQPTALDHACFAATRTGVRDGSTGTVSCTEWGEGGEGKGMHTLMRCSNGRKRWPASRRASSLALRCATSSSKPSTCFQLYGHTSRGLMPAQPRNLVA